VYRCFHLDFTEYTDIVVAACHRND